MSVENEQKTKKTDGDLSSHVDSHGLFSFGESDSQEEKKDKVKPHLYFQLLEVIVSHIYVCYHMHICRIKKFESLQERV